MISDPLTAVRRATVLACLALLAACGGGAAPAAESRVRVSLAGLGSNAVVPAGVGSLELLVTSPACGGPVIGWEILNVTPGQDAPPFDLTLPAGQPACFELSAWSGPNTTGELRYHGVTPGVVLAPDGAVQVTISLLPVDPAPPAVATLPAAGVSARTAIAQGSVDAGGNPALAWIEWGPTAAYGNTTPVQQVAASPFTLSAPLTGLQPSTTYHYRAVAAGSGQTVTGDDVAFTTAPPETASTVGVDFGAVSPPTVGVPREVLVERHGLQLAALVTPGGSATHAYLELADQGAWGRTSGVQSLGAGAAQVQLSGTFSGLPLGTSHVVRAVAVNAGGVTTGATTEVATRDGQWEGADEVSPVLSGRPSLAALPDGTVVLGGAMVGGAAVAVGGPMGWSAPEVAIPFAGSTSVVGTLDGNVVVTGIMRSGQELLLLATAGTPGAWGAPHEVDRWKDATGAPDLVVTMAAAGDGAVVLAWQRNDGLGGLRAVRWVDGGGYGSPVELDAGIVGTTRLSGGADGRVVAAWEGEGGTAVLAREYVPGAGWGPSIRLSAAGPGFRFLSGLSVAATGASAAIWNDVDPSNAFGTMVVARGSQWGWGPPEPLGPTGGSSYSDEAEVALQGDGSGLAVWRDAADVCQAARVAVDGTWSALQPVPLEKCFEPLLVLHPGGNAVLFSRALDAGTGAYRATRFRGGTWATTSTLTGAARGPAASITPDGSVALTFYQTWLEPIWAAWFR